MHGNVAATRQRKYAVDFRFNGFFEPVNNLPTLNVAKAGNAIPVKFSLGGNQGLDVFYNSTYPASQPISCSTAAPLDTIETTVTAGQSRLSYDSGTWQYTYVWKATPAVRDSTPPYGRRARRGRARAAPSSCARSSAPSTRRTSSSSKARRAS